MAKEQQTTTKRKRSSPENSVPPSFRPMPSISSDPRQFSAFANRQMLLSKPVNVGEFSLDGARNQQLGRSHARYLYEAVVDKKMSTNLAQGIGEFVEKQSDEGIDQILHWIAQMAAPNSSLKKTIHECEFVVWRGTLTRLLGSAYDVGSYAVGVKVACVKYKGVYFLREFDTQAKLLSESTRSDYQRRAGYAGYKFEQICTTDEIGQRPDTTAPVNPNNEFIGMFKATLSAPCVHQEMQQNGTNGNNVEQPPPLPSFRMLFGAEIDCISPQGQYMEIKTQFKEFGHGNGFGQKALKWWIQSYLVGIRQLVIGVHENLILNRIELHATDSLTKSFNEMRMNATICFAFLHQFLQTVKRYLDDDDEGILVVERLPTLHEFKFQFISPENAEATAQYRVISEEFKAHGWN